MKVILTKDWDTGVKVIPSGTEVDVCRETQMYFADNGMIEVEKPKKKKKSKVEKIINVLKEKEDEV